jgi:cytochrome c-type biogenesis protein CcmE
LTRRGRRLSLIAAALAVVGAAVALGLYALSGSIALFLSPSELAGRNVEVGSRLRIGGLVAPGSVQRSVDKLVFAITDGTKTMNVDCAGDCFANIPDLFREGQGVVAEGVLAAPDRLQSDRILAKHDERYMPREVVEALKRQGRWQEGEGVAKP